MIYTRNDIELELNKILAEKLAEGFVVFTSMRAFEVMPNGNERCHTVVISETRKEV